MKNTLRFEHNANSDFNCVEFCERIDQLQGNIVFTFTHITGREQYKVEFESVEHCKQALVVLKLEYPRAKRIA